MLRDDEKKHIFVLQKRMFLMGVLKLISKAVLVYRVSTNGITWLIHWLMS